jgi:hypothetical protein
VVLRLFGTPFEDSEPDDDDDGDRQTEQDRLPKQPMQICAERDMTTRHLVSLGCEVRVVELFDFPGNRERGVSPWHDLAPQERGAAKDLLGWRPVEQRIECLPVVVQLGLQAVNLVAPLDQRPQLGQCCDVGAPEFGELLAVLRCPFSCHVEQVVTHENAREVDVGAQPSEVFLDASMMRIELVELRVDVLRLARRGEHRHHDQDNQAA